MGKEVKSIRLDHLWSCVASICGCLEEQVGQTSGRTATDYREGVSPSPFQHCFPMVLYSVRLNNIWGGEQGAEGSTSDLHRSLQGETERKKNSAGSYKTSYNLRVPENNRISLCSSAKDVQPCWVVSDAIRVKQCIFSFFFGC